MSTSRRPRSRTGRAEAARRAHGDAQARAATPATPPPSVDTGPAASPDQALTEQPAAAPSPPDRRTCTGTAANVIGPTSEATRRLVAESRARQGLPPRIDNPAVIESLALFLRNALSTLDSDDNGSSGGGA